MSIRRTATIGLLAGSAAAAGLVALAVTATSSQASTSAAATSTAAASSPQVPAAFGRVMVFKAVTTEHADIDNGAEGPSVGDRFVFGDTLYAWGTKKKVGTDGGDCALVHVKDKGKEITAQCVATLSLKGGQITVQGLADVTSGKPSTVAVTGGTGLYRGATGTLTVDDQSETVAKLTLRLTRGGFAGGGWEADDDWSGMGPGAVGGGGGGGGA